MPVTRPELDGYRRLIVNLVGDARASLADFWDTLPDNPAQAARLIREFTPELIATFGDAGAGIAADFYDSIREGEGIADGFTARLGAAVPDEQTLTSTDWALRSLFNTDEDGNPAPDPEMAFRNLSGVVDRLVKAPSRDTLIGAAGDDPAKPRFARVPSLSKTVCRFCVMLASRGAVYHSAESAGEFRRFHDNCNCSIVPIFDNALPDGYDPSFYFDLYKKGRGYEPPKVVADEPDPQPKRLRVIEGDTPAPAPAPGTAATLPRMEPKSTAEEARLSNPFFREDPAYEVNCTHVVQAVEMRARGYDVRATRLPDAHFQGITGKGRSAWEIIDSMFKVPPGSDSIKIRTLRGRSTSGSRRTTEAIVGTWPDGARGYVVTQWKDSSSAHIFNVEKGHDGKIRFIEGQTTKDNPRAVDASGYFEEASFSTVVRTDDLILREDVDLSEFVVPRSTPRRTGASPQVLFEQVAGPLKEEIKRLNDERVELLVDRTRPIEERRPRIREISVEVDLRKSELQALEERAQRGLL